MVLKVEKAAPKLKPKSGIKQKKGGLTGNNH